MGISIYEFKCAMEEFGAEFTGYEVGSRLRDAVPTYRVGAVKFVHSGTYYVVQREHSVSSETLRYAMSKLGEEYPGKNHFWNEEIHTVKGLITISQMIANIYREELVDLMVLKIYQRMLKEVKARWCLPQLPSDAKAISGFEKLCEGVRKFDESVAFLFKDYDDTELAEIIAEKGLSIFVSDVCVSVAVKTSYADMKAKMMLSEKNSKPDFFYMLDTEKASVRHYYAISDDLQYDEVLYIGTWPGKEFSEMDLRISFSSGLIWHTYAPNSSRKATATDVSKMEQTLNMCLKKAMLI